MNRTLWQPSVVEACSPGPWTACIEEDGHEPIINGGNCLPVCEMYEIFGVQRKTMEANANMLAAAPEMYAALRLCWDAIRVYAPDYMHGMPREQYIEIAEEALAKAVGKESYHGD